MITYDQVEPETLDWFIPNVLPVGLTVMVSAPGCGKGTVMTKIMADFTRGRATCRDAQIPVSTVITVSAEDDPATCTAHRLRASQADTSRIIDMTWLGADHHMFTIGTSADDEKHGRSDDLPELQRMIREVNADPFKPDVRLIVLDPLNQLAGCKLRDNQTVRNKVMLPLHELAKKYSLAIVLVHHFTKSGSVAGSAAVVETARHCLEVHRSGNLRKVRIRKTNITDDTAPCFDYYITGEAPANSVRIAADDKLDETQRVTATSAYNSLRSIIGGRR